MLKKPGEDALGFPSYPKDIFAKPRSGGGSAGRRRSAPGAEEKNPNSVDDRKDLEKVEEPKPEKKPEVKLSNGKWLGPQGHYGQVIQASVEVVLPPEMKDLTRVTFDVREILPDGRVGSHVTGGQDYVKEGKVVCDVKLPMPQMRDGRLPEKAYFQFLAKHAYSQEHQGPRLEAVPGSPLTGFESVIYYSPTREEYLHFETKEEFDTLLEATKELEELQGKTREAWEEPDPSMRRQKLEEIDAKADKMFGDKAVGKAGGALEELILIRQFPAWGKPKSWNYVSAYTRKSGKVSCYWRKDTDPKIRENFKDLFAKNPGTPEGSPLLNSECKLKLWKGHPWEDKALRWHKVEKEGEIAGQHFIFTKEAALGRFMFGWDGVDAKIDLKKKKIKIGTSGQLSIGLAEGTMEGQIPCPEEGINLLEWIRVKKAGFFLKENRQCLVRLNFILAAKAFAGLTLKGALSLPHIDLSKETPKKKGEAGFKGEGLLGAQGSDSLAVVPEWSPTSASPQFKALGKAQLEVGVTVGLAAEIKLDVGYKDGKFRFRFSSGAAFGIGPRGGIQFEVGLEEGWHLIGYLLNSVDYHYVKDISSEAFEAYKNYAFTLMTEGKGALIDGVALVGGVIGEFTGWLKGIGLKIEKIKASLSESSYYGATLSKVPPEALGQALLTIMHTREEEDFKPIIWILYSTVRRGADYRKDESATHKLKWTLRSVASEVVVPEDDKDPTYEAKKEEALRKGIQKLVDFGKGIGYADRNGKAQERNEDFLHKLQVLLHENGVVNK